MNSKKQFGKTVRNTAAALLCLAFAGAAAGCDSLIGTDNEADMSRVIAEVNITKEKDFAEGGKYAAYKDVVSESNGKIYKRDLISAFLSSGYSSVQNGATYKDTFNKLAETLVALIGEHHGQSERAQQLGLKIIGHMRERCDARSAEKKLNYTLLATPAEGLSGRFVKIDQKRYGRIAGVTDREYYTNSFHIPVYCPISAFDKIRLEAPYHALTNAGHISYIEMDGDPTKNLDAFEAVVRAMHDAGIGYGSINHPVDRDPVCGYNGIIGDSCPKCGRQEEEVHFERIRRITGYLVGTLDRFNNGKRAEERDRVKHGM